MNFRDLKENEIDVRIAQVRGNEVLLLLYKDARVDMNILDETVGQLNWKRTHTRDNKNCIVSIWDSEKKEWISKEDTGKESYTEAEKGLASDSFKRACFNWGIGRELYTAPTIKVSAPNVNIHNNKTYDKFKVSKIKIENKEITELEIMNLETFKIVFRFKKSNTKINTEELRKKIVENKISLTNVLTSYNIKNLSNMTIEQFDDCLNKLSKYDNRTAKKEAV